MRAMGLLCGGGVLLAAIAWGQAPRPPAPAPASDSNARTAATVAAPATQPKKPAGNLEYWLNQAQPAGSQPADANRSQESTTNPFDTGGNFRRADALPGVIQLSSGQVLAGGVYTTVEKDWLVWVESQKRWRRVPFVAVLGITAVVVEEKMEQVWRWKEMGVPERVYTGEEYPTRRLEWTFHLIDDSTITGAVKGQPIWIEEDGRKSGPFVLHENVKGAVGQKMTDLVTVKRIIVSRRLLEELRGGPARRSLGEGGAPVPPRPGASRSAAPASTRLDK